MFSARVIDQQCDLSRLHKCLFLPTQQLAKGWGELEMAPGLPNLPH